MKSLIESARVVLKGLKAEVAASVDVISVEERVEKLIVADQGLTLAVRV